MLREQGEHPEAEGPPVTAPTPELVQLPADVRGAAAVGYEPASHHVAVPASLGGALQGDGRALLLGVFQAFLFRHAEQPSFCVDVSVYDGAGSTPRCVSLAASVDADATVASLVEAAERALAGAGAAAAAGHRTSNVAVTFCPGAVDLARYGVSATGHDLHLLVTGRPSPAPIEIVYNARRFRPDTVERFSRRLLGVLAASAADRRTPVRRLPVLDAEERRLLTEAWDSGVLAGVQRPVHDVFAELAARQPRAVAAVFKDEAIGYAELDARSNRLARHLIAAGVRPETTVAVCVLPSFDILVAMLATWKAGGIYVPLDPTHPEALIRTILDEAKPVLVLTQWKLRALTQPETFPQLCLDTDLELLDALPATAPELSSSLERSAYLLYTSGTTGKPKGVLASHANLAHYVEVARRTYRFSEKDVFCSLARYTFSISLFELVSPLCCGGSLHLFERDEVLAPDRLAQNLARVTVLHAGPSLLGALFRHLRTIPPAPGHFARMRHASSGGDLVPPYVLEEMKQVFENAEIYVIYGCTEISCMGTTYPVSRAERVTASYVGRPFPGVAVRLVDPERGLVPVGVVGEICFAGDGVVRGYLDRPELDAEKFVELDGRRYYTTGDMGRFDADGELEILGRRDFQIQLRGIRIELAGIENTVKELGLATQCAVVVKKLSDQDERLIAFVVGPTAESVAAFRRALAQHLPDYMVPQGMVAIDAMPVTANGKLDRKKLQELPWEAKGSDSGTAPRTAVERKIAAAFAGSLGLAEVGIDDDFFDLGGHSLLAVTLIHEIENRLGLTLPPGVLFESTTVRALAEHATDSFGSVQKPLLLAGKGDKPALFMLLGVHLYRDLARRLSDEYSVFGVYAGRELVMFEATGEAPPVTELAREYIEIIRRQQPTGPYRVGGMSFGGIVAYEAARQLEAAGEEVMFLGMIDAVLPEPGLKGRLAKVRRLFGLPPRDFVTIASSPLRTRWNAAFGKRAHSEFMKYGADAKLGELEARRQAAYARSVGGYASQMSAFAVNATVIVSGRRLRRFPLQSPSCGWSAFVPGIDVHVLDSDHIALVEEPMVAKVAEIFRVVLARNEEARSMRLSRHGRSASVAPAVPSTPEFPVSR